MQSKRSSTFLVGFLIGGLIWLIFWYWQKSTSAEDGALVLLDRLAAAEARVRDAQTRLQQFQQQQAKTAVSPPQPDNLEQIKGIGPHFAQRLLAAGVTTIANVAVLDSHTLSQLLDIGPSRAEAILTEAKTFL